MLRRDSVSLYQFKRLLQTIERLEGRGTELVSLYIPPEKSISDVINYLRQEYATASNIKSKQTRKNVQDAIESAIQRLKLFDKPGPTGLVIFSGAIPQNSGQTSKIEVHHIFPPEPITTFLYRCDSKFLIDPLKDLLREKAVYGVIVIDNEEAAVAVVKGRSISQLKTYTSGVPGKHHAGGQSARRFERLREMTLNDFYKRVAEKANELFLQYPEIKGVILAGPGPTKEVFAQGDYLHYTLRDKIHIVDTSYSGESGVREAVAKSADFLKEVRMIEEQKLIQRFMSEATRPDGLAVYGEKQVFDALQKNMVELLLVSEELDRVEVKIRCQNCGYETSFRVDAAELQSELPKRLAEKCPSCQNQSLTHVESKLLIDRLIEEADRLGARVELISSEHEEGEMFKKAFNGVAGILRHRGGY
ncbi:MAG: peptide chain release factor aRF-1 [Candidatus Caldarchaeum sp.]|nr:peptide chain release factor aRF-1 [Candidatus Caldarchaeum sp.]MCX8200802.1 peptide chain release factor aRF-1 [Candidatus Caldarchaeum sp.]MDW8063130.1 peptide chain release factor aRF-1 [Candidatus Caldarchaeum sp.]MDW8434683.1 peptide chain release factor aRF-1 [Candidatus Caldarchaeum sp.]